MSTSEKLRLSVTLRGINEIHCVCENPREDCSYAFYVYRDGKDVGHYAYQKKAEISYWAQENGEYTFKIFQRELTTGGRISCMSPKLRFENRRKISCNMIPPKRRFDWMRNVWAVLKEIWVNRGRMLRVSQYSYKVLNQDAYLGSLWNFLNPLIQIATYWFVFGIGLRAGSDVEGYPYIVWMLCGMIPWFFIAPCITQGTGSIRKRGVAALKMRYPVATMPLEAVLVSFYSHAVMMGILIVVLLVFGVFPSVYWLNLIYYFVYEIVFFTSLGMVTSVISMIAIDFQKLVNSLIRLLFYLTPILWNMERLPLFAQFVLKLNPCLYVVDGYRNSLLYHTAFYEDPYRMIFFWAVNLILLIVGCNLQMKYKNQFLDME